MTDQTPYVIPRDEVPAELARVVALNEERIGAVKERLIRHLEYIISHAQNDLDDLARGRYSPAGWWRSYADDATREMAELETRGDVLTTFRIITAYMAPAEPLPEGWES